MNRTQRRQLARAQGTRGSKAKRKGSPRPERAPYVAPIFRLATGRHVSEHEFTKTVETAKRLSAKGFEIVPDLSSTLWTPGTGAA